MIKLIYFKAQLSLFCSGESRGILAGVVVVVWGGDWGGGG